MQADLLRTATDHNVVRANPIPNAPVHPTVKGLESWGRDFLCEEINVYTRAWNSRIREATRRAFTVDPRAISGAIFDALEGPKSEGREKALRAEWGARVAYWKAQELKKDVAAHNNDVELREEIIDALVAEGKARHVAANLTNTQAKMLAEGRRLGVI